MELPTVFTLGSREMSKVINCIENKNDFDVQKTMFTLYFQKLQEFIDYFNTLYADLKDNVIHYKEVLKEYQLPSETYLFDFLQSVVNRNFEETRIVNFTLFSYCYHIVFGYVVILQQNIMDTTYDYIKNLLYKDDKLVSYETIMNSDIIKQNKTIPFIGKKGVYGINTLLNMVINYDCRLIGFSIDTYPVHAGMYTDAPFEYSNHDMGHIDIINDNLWFFGKNNIKNIYNNILINNNVKIELTLFHLFNLVHEITIYDTYISSILFFNGSI